MKPVAFSEAFLPTDLGVAAAARNAFSENFIGVDAVIGASVAAAEADAADADDDGVCWSLRALIGCCCCCCCLRESTEKRTGVAAAGCDGRDEEATVEGRSGVDAAAAAAEAVAGRF